jgi:hypothetical protein
MEPRKTRFTIELPALGTDDPTMITDHALGVTYCDFEDEAQLIRALDMIDAAREEDPSIPILLDTDFFALWTVAGQLLDPAEWNQPEPKPKRKPERARSFIFHSR